jgi:hypothetical protein
MPKMSRRALSYVTSCFGERKTLRLCTDEPAEGT